MMQRWWDKELEDFIPEEKAAKAALSLLCNMEEENRQKMLDYLSRGKSDAVDVPRMMEIIYDCLPLYLEATKRVKKNRAKASLPKRLTANSGFAVTLTYQAD